MTENTEDMEIIIEEHKESEKSIQDKAYEHFLKIFHEKSGLEKKPTEFEDIVLSPNFDREEDFDLVFSNKRKEILQILEVDFSLYTSFGRYACNFSAHVSTQHQFDALEMLLKNDTEEINSSSELKEGYIQNRFKYVESSLEFANQYQVEAMRTLGVSRREYALKIDNEHKIQALKMLVERNIDQEKHQWLLDLIAEFVNSFQVDLLNILLESDLEQSQYQSLKEFIGRFLNPYQSVAFKVLGISHIEEVLKFDSEFQVKLLNDTQLIYHHLNGTDQIKLSEYIAYCLSVESYEQYIAQPFNIVAQKFLTEYQFGGLEILGIIKFEYILKLGNQYQVSVLKQISGGVNLESYLDSVLDFTKANQVNAFSVLGISRIRDALMFEHELSVKALEKTKTTYKYLSTKAIAELPDYINSCLKITCEARFTTLVDTESLEEAQRVTCAGESSIPDEQQREEL